ncbi:TPA: hypothetical protein ACNVBB_000976 [Klebsiella aerogenes]
MTNNQLTGYRADGGEISIGRIKEIADNPYGDEEKQNLAKRILIVEAELQERLKADKPPVHPTVASEKLDDETLQELIEFRRTTLEYHSKEGNKVQTIIHGVTLSALLELQGRRKINADLTMWVKRLGYSLRCAKPSSKLPGDAMAYLSANGLISVEDILR